MESEAARELRARLEVLRAAPPKWLDGYDREFLANVLAGEDSFDYLPAITTRRIEKILQEEAFQRRHPNAQWVS